MATVKGILKKDGTEKMDPQTASQCIPLSSGIDQNMDPEDDSIPKRDSWTNHREYLLSMVGTCVGLANIWRFPYLAYENGGGAFLIPYLIAALCTGMPMFLMEVSLGQFYSRGPITAWSACPPFKGIGIGGTVMCYFVNVYYIVVISWVLFYLWHSLTPNLPWKSCSNAWNLQDRCVLMADRAKLICTDDPLIFNQSLHDFKPPEGELESFQKLQQFGWSLDSPSFTSGHNLTSPLHAPTSSIFSYEDLSKTNVSDDDIYCLVNNNWVMKANLTEPVREFWERKVLKISSGLEEVGGLNYEMTVSLIVAWVMCYFCIWKGIKWTGKIVYFTALVPYFLLLVLLIQSVSLKGAMVGIRLYLIPDPAKLVDFNVWLHAFSQVFYSYALAFGSLVTFGSFNKFNTNCVKDTIIISSINSFTSFLSGFIVFGVIGFMSVSQNKPIEEVAVSGAGLAFLVYPSATNEMPLSSLWSIIFFFTLVMIGLDSEFCFVESFVTTMTDQFPRQLRPHKELFTLGVCVTSCILGLSCVTEGGMYVFQLLDSYACSGICIVYLVFWSSIAIGWGYGADRWILSIKAMIGYHPGNWWKICWQYIVPVSTLIIFIINVANWKPLTYIDYEYTTFGNAVGWLLASASMVWVPVYFIYYIITCKKTQKTCKLQLIEIFRPLCLEEMTPTSSNLQEEDPCLSTTV